MLDRFARAGHSPRADRIDPLRTLTAEVVGDHATRALGDLRDPAAVDALRALAVCGDLLDFPLVCTLAGPHSVSESRLRAALTASGLTTLRDGHPRVQDAVVRARVLQEMSPADRAELYARAAGLAQRVAADDQGIADLLLLARPVGDPWAVDTLRRGFTSALRSGRRDLAVAYLARALDEPLTAEDRARIEFQLASVEMVTAPAAAERRLGGLIRATRPGPGAGLRARATDLCLLGGDTRAARHALAGAIDSAPAAPEPRRGTTGAPAVPPEAEPPATPRTHLVPHRPYAGTPPGATGPDGRRPTAPDLPARPAPTTPPLVRSRGRSTAGGGRTGRGPRRRRAARTDGPVPCRLLPAPRRRRPRRPPRPRPARRGAQPGRRGSLGLGARRGRRPPRGGAQTRPLRLRPRRHRPPAPRRSPAARLPRPPAHRRRRRGGEPPRRPARRVPPGAGGDLGRPHPHRPRRTAHPPRPPRRRRPRPGRCRGGAPLGPAPPHLPPVLARPEHGHRSPERPHRTGPRDRRPAAATARPRERHHRPAPLRPGVLARVDDEPHQAREHFRACGRWLLRHGCVNPAVQPWRSLAAEAAHTLGDTEEAGRLVHEEVRLARRWGAASPSAAPSSASPSSPRRTGSRTSVPPSPPSARHPPAPPTPAVIELAAAEREENERRTAVALGPTATVLPPVGPPPGRTSPPWRPGPSAPPPRARRC
ncbi:hypothetical protein NQP46_01325 [Streptomyces albus]|nr:hypothetical protein NQP46_01325 [Streptomyces albus]